MRTRDRTALYFIFVCLAFHFSIHAQTQPPSSITANIDSTVSPRDDFFRYANGGWLKRNPIPSDASRWGINNLKSDIIYAQLRQLSERAAASKAPPGSDERLIGDFWYTGMDVATRNKQGISSLQPDLKRIDRINGIGDLIDMVASMHKKEIITDSFNQPWGVLFAGSVKQDERHSDRWIYSLSQGGISTGVRVYTASDPQRLRIREAFREYLYKTFLRLHGDNLKAKASANAVFELESQLAQAFYQGDGYQKLRLVEIVDLAPAIDWDRYFRGIGISKIESVNMQKPGFFKALDTLLQKVPIETWKDYLRFWLVVMNASFLDDATYNEFFVYNSSYTGQVQPRPRWKRVIWQEKNWIGQPLARMYLKKYFPANVKAQNVRLGEQIRLAFQERLTRLDWMSKTTKENGLLKLRRLKIMVGFPDKWVDFSTMPLRRDSYALNLKRSAVWFHNREIEQLNALVDRTLIDLRPDLSGDAEYDDHNNEVRIGPGAIAASGAREQLEDALAYGGRGALFGHEISHAFDSEGRHYDANGNKVDWWTAEDDAEFMKRAQVLVNEYSMFTPLPGMRLDGRTSLRENIADLVRLRTALDAFKKTAQFKKNERIGGFTPLQRFFFAFAQMYMSQERDELLATRLNGAYAPNRERVNGVLMNIPEFYEAFNVQPGDGMYLAESRRAQIW